MRPGMEWDALRRTWKPVNYLDMTVEQMRERRDSVIDRKEEVDKQIENLLPEAAAQALLNKSAQELQELIVDAIKKAPAIILGLIV